MSSVAELPSAEDQAQCRLHLRAADDDAADLTIGAKLKSHRLRKNLDHAIVAAKLKLRTEQVAAIEADDFARLPGRTYAVGFIRAYAKLVGLPADASVEQFKAQTASETQVPVELVFPEVQTEKRWPNGSIFVVAFVIAVLIYGVAQLTMPSREAPITTAKAAVTSVIVEDAPPPGAVVSAAQPKPSVPVFAERPPGGLRVALSESASLPATAAAPASVAISESETSRITLKAVEQTYVQIKDPALARPRSILLARLLSPGESINAPDRAGLILLTGNAGGVHVEVDGRSIGVLGRSGQVIAHLPLEPAYFLSRLSTSQQ